MAAKPVKPAAWQVPQEPQALSLPQFRQWQHRIARHREHLMAAKEVTDISQYEREVQELERASVAHQCSRKAQRREEEAKLKKDNVRLVQKLCDVARQSEKRQEAISARPDPAGASVLKFKPQRMKRQQAIFADNLALLHRLESVRSVVPSASQAVESHSRHQAARLSRSRRPVGMARPFPPARPGGPRRGPSLQLVRPEQSRMESLPDAPQPEVTFSDSSEAGSRRAPLHLAEAEAVLLLPALEDREDLSRMLPITYNEHGMGEVGEVGEAASPASPAKVQKETSDAGSEFPEDFEDPSESESER